MSQDALGQLKHLKTARARWPFPDVLPSAHPAQAPVNTCPTPGCGQKRIVLLCPHRLCRKHCRQLKLGCLMKTHLPDNAPPPTNTPLLSLNALPALAPLPHRPLSLSLPLAQAQLLLPHSPVAGPSKSTPPSTQTINALPDARYMSHMPTIFTDQLRREQELLEDQCQCDTECIQNEKRSKQSVVVYAWNQDASPPLI